MSVSNDLRYLDILLLDTNTYAFRIQSSTGAHSSFPFSPCEWAPASLFALMIILSSRRGAAQLAALR